MTDADPLGRAWGWVAHLRGGGTTPWSAWSGAAEPSARVLPGAQQLELLRWINLAAGSGPVHRAADHRAADHRAADHRTLADRVLAAAAVGRGQADLPLVGAGVGDPAYGPRPVDPARLAAHELTRVASVLLAEDLIALGPDPLARRLARPWRRRIRLVGDPLIVAPLRDELLARGRPQGGPRPFVVVVAGPLDELLAHTWTQRCFEHGSKPWDQWLRFWRERDQLPARVDLADSVRRWGGRGPLVRIVTDHDRLPRQVGVRHLPDVTVPGADQAELARRVAAVVGLLVTADRRPDLMRTLRSRMPGTDVPPAAVPAAELAWVGAAARRVTRELSRARYPVVGDLADLAPRTDRPAAVGAPGALDQQVLDLAVAMLVDPGWRGHGEDTTEGRAER